MTTLTAARDAGADTSRINRWWFVITGFISLIVGVNIIYTLFNLLGPDIRAEFGWSSLAVSSGLTYFLICDGISVFVTGVLIDRIGLRRTAVPLAAVWGAALASLAFLPPHIAYLYLACIVAGLAVGPATQVAHSIVVTAWFGKNRGLALGILNVGLGLCGTLTPFAVDALRTALGWRGTFGVVGIVCALVPIIAFGLVTRMPPGFEAARAEARRAGTSAGVPLTRIARTSKAFWIISIAVFLISAATVGVLGQVVVIATGQGADHATALIRLSVVSFSSIGSRFIVGFLLDRLWAPGVSAVLFVLCGIGLVLLAQTTAVPLLYIGAVLIGGGLGSEGDIAAYVTSRYIPKLSYARVYGFVIFLFAQGAAVGTFALNLSLTLTGSVHVAAWGIVILSVIAGLMMLFLGPYQFDIEGKATPAVEIPVAPQEDRKALVDPEDAGTV